MSSCRIAMRTFRTCIIATPTDGRNPNYNGVRTSSMMTHRTSRLLVALCAIASLLFTQLAVAAYACPGAPAVASDSAADSGCDPANLAESGLCHAHCVQQAQSIEKPVVLSLPSAPATGLHVPYLAVTSEPFVEATGQESLLARATAPPLAIRNCCLRI